MKPAPTAAAPPVIDSAVDSRSAVISAGVRAGLACSINAATPAASGAAAEVPLNGLNTLVVEASGAVKFTLFRISGEARRVPFESNRNSPRPTEENGSRASVPPKAGVL